MTTETNDVNISGSTLDAHEEEYRLCIKITNPNLAL